MLNFAVCSPCSPRKWNHYDIVKRALPLHLDLSFHPGSVLNHVIVSKALHLLQRLVKLTRDGSGGGNWTEFLRFPHLILWVYKGKAAWYAGAESTGTRVSRSGFWSLILWLEASHLKSQKRVEGWNHWFPRFPAAFKFYTLKWLHY